MARIDVGSYPVEGPVCVCLCEFVCVTVLGCGWVGLGGGGPGTKSCTAGEAVTAALQAAYYPV